jgi:hypothetical protein
MEMYKDEAIEYLKRKNKIKGITTYNKKEQKEIKRVMKEGKIYGDPVVEIMDD